MAAINVVGGGTVFHVRPHLALAAPAYGTLARKIHRELKRWATPLDVELVLTEMCGISEDERELRTYNEKLETNEDIKKYIDRRISDDRTKMIFMTAALCDFEGSWVATDTDLPSPSGKDQPRLKSDRYPGLIKLTPAEKIISRIRKTRKDIFLVACKTTAGATPDEQFIAGLNLLKKNSCNLVLANDVHTRKNMIITPEESRYEGEDRDLTILRLVNMAIRRSEGKFTRSMVLPGSTVPWSDPRIPDSLRTVVNHCIKRGAYKEVNGVTAGHFAVRLAPNKFLTSMRKSNFNKLEETGLVYVETIDDDRVVAIGGKPSVGGQSQRIVFAEHPGLDCIVHFHCPPKVPSSISKRPQWMFECGSHECGRNTSEGLVRYDFPSGGFVKAVMLTNHGPNIVFNSGTNPQEIIDFIETNFCLDQKTDGILRPSLGAFSEVSAHSDHT